VCVCVCVCVRACACVCVYVRVCGREGESAHVSTHTQIHIQKLYFYSALCDNEFQHLSEKERIYQYSAPKVHRLLQILKIYTPFYTKETNTSEKKASAGKNLSIYKIYNV